MYISKGTYLTIHTLNLRPEIGTTDRTGPIRTDDPAVHGGNRPADRAVEVQVPYLLTVHTYGICTVFGTV